MGRGRTFWLILPRPVRELPADLAAVLVLTVLTVLCATVPGVRETPLRIGLGLIFVLFVPGYALVAALFPKAYTPNENNESRHINDDGIDGIERVALSFGLSIAAVPLIGLLLNYTPWGIHLIPTLLTVSAFTIIMVIVAAVRRWSLPAEERFAVPYQHWIEAIKSELFHPETRTDRVLNILLVGVLLLAMSSVVYAVAVPHQGESFSEFYLLTEDEEGELVADNYPTEFVAGESQSLIIGIGNQEHETTNYSVIVQLQQVERSEDGIRVIEREQIDTFETQLEPDETWHHQHDITPNTTGEELRLVYLLYIDDVPGTPTEDNAYRSIHLWITVEESDTGVDSDESST